MFRNYERLRNLSAILSLNSSSQSPDHHKALKRGLFKFWNFVHPAKYLLGVTRQLWYNASLSLGFNSKSRYVALNSVFSQRTWIVPITCDLNQRGVHQWLPWDPDQIPPAISQWAHKAPTLALATRTNPRPLSCPWQLLHPVNLAFIHICRYHPSILCQIKDPASNRADHQLKLYLGTIFRTIKFAPYKGTWPKINQA